MRYFTPELIEAWHSPDKAVVKAVNEQWAKNTKAYSRQLDKIPQGLSRKTKLFFRYFGLHDGDIESVVMKGYWDSRWYKHCKMEIGVVHPETGVVYVLIYTDVSRCIIQQPEGGSDPVLETWRYDEITRLKDNRLQHEILCVSEATILLQFKRLVIKKNGKRKFG